MPNPEDTVTFDATAKTVTVQAPTPEATVIDGATYIANLEAAVKLHSDNVAEMQGQQQTQWDNANSEIAAEQALLDAAITALQNGSIPLAFPSTVLTDALAAQAARPALIAAVDIAAPASPSQRMQAQ